MNPAPFDLRERNIWVIGGAGYLGRAVVQLLARMEAKVLCADLGRLAYEFVDEADLAGSVSPATLDINDTAAAISFVATHIKERGVPDGVVILTYASTSRPLDELSTEEFDRVNHGNLTATFAMARAAGRHMAERNGGSIVLFSSMYGTVSPDPRLYESPMNPNPIEYGAGKAGIQQLARYFAVHWGRNGVRCNAISPGPFPNPGVCDGNPEFVARLADKVPLGRIGSAGEIAGAVAFLLSDASSFVTGHNLAVDGGWTAW